MILTEKHSSSNFKYEYLCSSSGALAEKKPSISVSLVQRVKEIFLPQGYPESVSNDYLEYQIWDTIQALVSTISATVANQAILKGIGVGDEKATVLAATITWIIKDGAGLIGRILFAYWKGTFLDCNCKRWRLFADILNDVTIFLDIFTSVLPRSTFLLIVCISSVGRSIVGVAGGATRAALTMHQARKNNIADVSAKDGSQESMSNLIGLVVNLLVVSIITSDTSLVWGLVTMLTLLHLYCNYRAMRAVCMTSFNQSRFHLVSRYWLQTGQMLSVRRCNLSEPIWTGLGRASVTDLHLGCSIGQLSPIMQRQLEWASVMFSGEKYILLLERKPSRSSVSVCVLLKPGALCRDQMKAVYQAEIIDYHIRIGHILFKDNRPASGLINKSFQNHGISGAVYDYPALDLIEQSLAFCNKTIYRFSRECLQAGWVLDPVLFGADEWSVETG